MRKTKIVCTMGPAVSDINVLKELVKSGMNVARLNFSHGGYDEHKQRIEDIKKVRNELYAPVAILLDTKGPEIRIREFEEGSVNLVEGNKFVLTCNNVIGNESIVSVTYENLYNDIGIGDRILLDDGLIELKVENIVEKDIICQVINGGMLSNKKSINIPGAAISLPYLSDKDVKDIIFGIENDVDIIAASFVRTAYDVLEVRKVLEENGGDDIHIIAKIENSEGVNNIDAIINVSDGIMVARGDMGVEIPFEDLPSIQKLLIEKCYKAGKKVITATQMLDSMIRNPRPTRAETTDVANAIYDGTSAIMLSGETAIGKYPIESVRTMSKIAEKTEKSINYKKRFHNQTIKNLTTTVASAISHATCTTAMDLGAKAIITVTSSGATARMVSSFRPNCPIIATTPAPKVYRQLALSWGVIPVLSEQQKSMDDLFDHAVDKSLGTGIVKNGDLVVIAGGLPVGISGTTNIIKAHLVGHVLAEGKGINSLSVSGKVYVAKNVRQTLEEFENGDILVVNSTTNEYLPIIKKAKGVIVEESGMASHAAIVGMTLDIPVITGAKNATSVLKTGTIVTIDSSRGLVYSGVVKAI